MHPKDAEGIANSVDPDQTAPLGADLGLHCLPRPVCPKTLDHYGKQRTTKALIRLRRLLCTFVVRIWHMISVGHNTLFLSTTHLCFIEVFICDLFVSHDDPLMG